MPYQHVLIPTDGSECSQMAVLKGLELAKITGGRVTFLHVIDTSVERMITSWSLPVIPEQLAALEREGRAALDWALERAREAGVEARTNLVRGHPVPVIVEVAAGHDLVVMGTHGRRGLERLLLGSVADGVLRQSRTPVLLTRAAAEPSAAEPGREFKAAGGEP